MACAAAQTPDDDGQGTPTGGQVGVSGSTGNHAGAGGTSPLPTAGTSTVPSGGKPAGTAGSAAAGGTVATTGGTLGTAGTVAAGGTASGTCPPYTGTLATDSTIFMAGFGTSTTGMWSGYGYTYKYGTAIVAPGMGTSCFAGAKMCANGSVPAADTAGAGLGWNISQMMGASTMAKVPITKPVVLKFAGVKAGMRVQLSASATVSYCYTLTAADAAGVTIPLASFKTECWGTTGIAYDGVVPIEAIQVAVPGGAAAAQTFDFCLLDIEPGT
jgi:hypothetical protein